MMVDLALVIGSNPIIPSIYIITGVYKGDVAQMVEQRI
jgi:hypothetical protein